MDNSKPPESQWKDMSYNSFIAGVLTSTNVDIQQPIHDLLEGKRICTKIFNSVSFIDEKIDLAEIYTFMYYIGYITIDDAPDNSDNNAHSIRIPNREIYGWYMEMIPQFSSGNETENIPTQPKEEEAVATGNAHHERHKEIDEEKYSMILE